MEFHNFQTRHWRPLITEMVEEAAEEVVAESEEQDFDNQENVMMKNDQNNGQEGSLNMTLQGNMTLRLSYEFSGQQVTVAFNDQAIQVQLADGTEFKIPVGQKKVPLRKVG